MSIRGIGRLRRIARRLTNAFVPRAIILLYHRVAELPLDPQLLCVSRKNFAEQLEVLRRYGRALQVRALGQVLASENRSDRAVLVTFDDGYADNLYNAKPLLERYDIPATVFVTSGYIGATREFWYDDLERILLHTGPLPQTLGLKINEHSYKWDLHSTVHQSHEPAGNGHNWNVTRKDNPTVRHCLYRTLFERLQPLADGERQKVLDYLAAWAGMDTIHRPSHRTLSPEELTQLAYDGLIEIGSHTMSHPILSGLPLSAQRDEISRSKACLETMLEHPVISFAYPFGGPSHYTDETVDAVRDAGFEWACSNFAGMVRPKTDPLQLPRFLVRDWDGDEFARNLKQWADA